MREGRRRTEVDVLVVGAGPAGLATAAELARSGAGRVVVLDREQQAGGIPRHSHHTGYGLRDLHRVMTGPRYARHYVDLAVGAGATLRTGASVTGWAGPRSLDITSPEGLERCTARAVVLATGARERPRSARMVPGSRPAGVLTTGELQQMVVERAQPVGVRAIVVGAEHVSYSALLTLHHAHVDVVGLVTEQPRHQSYAAFRIGGQLVYRTPTWTGVRVVAIRGEQRVTGVELETVDGSKHRFVECDTVVFTGDWIPDHELARAGGLAMDPGTRGPAVDTALRTSVPGVFAAGNLLHPVETADAVALGGRHVAGSIARYLDGERTCLEAGVPVQAVEPLLWVAPNVLAPGATAAPRGRFVLWSSAFATRPRLQVRQGDRLLWQGRQVRPLVPNRPAYLPDGWRCDVRPGGAPVEVLLG